MGSAGRTQPDRDGSGNVESRSFDHRPVSEEPSGYRPGVMSRLKLAKVEVDGLTIAYREAGSEGFLELLLVPGTHRE